MKILLLARGMVILANSNVVFGASQGKGGEQASGSEDRCSVPLRWSRWAFDMGMNADEAGRRDGLDSFSFYRKFHSADNNLQPIAPKFGSSWISKLSLCRPKRGELYTEQHSRGTTENLQNSQNGDEKEEGNHGD